MVHVLCSIGMVKICLVKGMRFVSNLWFLRRINLTMRSINLQVLNICRIPHLKRIVKVMTKPLFWLIFNPSYPHFLYNFLIYLGWKGLNLPSQVYIVLMCGISCFSGIFVIKARILPVLLEIKDVGVEFRKNGGSSQSQGWRGVQVRIVEKVHDHATRYVRLCAYTVHVGSSTHCCLCIDEGLCIPLKQWFE